MTGWRNAEVGNLERMKREYPATTEAFLEENFRSTSSILDAALRVVQQDTSRIDKGLFTTHARGAPVSFRVFADADEEAEYIALEIQRLVHLSAGMLSHADVRAVE